MLNLTMLNAVAWSIADIVVVVILLAFAFVCAKKGFIDCLFGFISIIASLAVAILCTKLFISVTGGLFGLQDVFSGTFQDALLKIKGFDIDISIGGLEAALAEQNLPKFLVDLLIDNFGDETIAAGTTLALLVGQTCSRLLITGLSFLILFIATKLLINLVKHILKALAEKIALIGSLDRLLGAVVGIAEGLLLVSFILSILSYIPSEGIMIYLNESMLAGWLYNHNLLSIIMGWIAVL